jgi:hypothetical protein
MILAVAFALAAAFCSAVNLITQHAASVSAPEREKGWRLALYLLRHPLWLLGWAAAAGTFVFQALALHNGPMSVVQPLLVTELAFVLLRWPVYALIGAGIAGTLLEQAALHVGPLSVSQPMLVIINPFASIILSVWLFSERFTNSPAEITVAVLSFAVMAAGVTMLTRTAPQDLSPSEPVRA